MKKLAFHSLLRWKIITLPILTTSLIHFSSKGLKNILFKLGSEKVKRMWRLAVKSHSFMHTFPHKKGRLRKFPLSVVWLRDRKRIAPYIWPRLSWESIDRFRQVLHICQRVSAMHGLSRAPRVNLLKPLICLLCSTWTNCWQHKNWPEMSSSRHAKPQTFSDKFCTKTLSWLRKPHTPFSALDIWFLIRNFPKYHNVGYYAMHVCPCGLFRVVISIDSPLKYPTPIAEILQEQQLLVNLSHYLLSV